MALNTSAQRTGIAAPNWLRGLAAPHLFLIASLGLALGFFMSGWIAASRTPHIPEPVRMGLVTGCYLDTPNGICEAGFGETCSTCPQDCCTAPKPPDEPDPNPCNNNNVCEAGENTVNCGDCPSECGDLICAPHEVSTCPNDCPISVTCGDQVCSAYETFSTCPLDCDPPTRTPTVTVTSTSTRVPTQTRTPTFTPVPTEPESSPTETVEPTEATTEPTATHTPKPTITPTATRTGPAASSGTNCRIVSVSEIDEDVLKTFIVRTQGYTAQAWMVCEKPPTDVCLPTDPVLGLSEQDLSDIWLLDCSGRLCNMMQATSLEKGDVCYAVALSPGDPGCAQGCAFARIADPPREFGLSWGSTLLFILAAVVLGLVIVLMATRRRREKEEVIEIPTS